MSDLIQPDKFRRELLKDIQRIHINNDSNSLLSISDEYTYSRPWTLEDIERQKKEEILRKSQEIFFLEEENTIQPNEIDDGILIQASNQTNNNNFKSLEIEKSSSLSGHVNESLISSLHSIKKMFSSEKIGGVQRQMSSGQKVDEFLSELFQKSSSAENSMKNNIKEDREISNIDELYTKGLSPRIGLIQ